MARRNGTIAAPPRERAEEVYSAALKLFREKGYHATSMQDIAAAVGLYKGSLYHYIGGKEELLVQVFERAMGSLVADVERVVSDAAVRPSDQLRRIVGLHVAAVAENLDALTVYLHEYRALTGEAFEKVAAQRDRYAQLVGEVIERGVRAGEFRADDVRIATLGVIGMCNWVCQWYRPGGRLAPSQIAAHFADLVLGGLTAS